MNRGFAVRLLLMLGLAALLAVRMGLVGRGTHVRGSAGVSSGEYGGGERVAAGRAPAATGALLPPLASALGVAWQPTGDGGIAHSAVVAMVDRAGRVRSRQIGLSDDPARLAAAWRAVQ